MPESSPFPPRPAPSDADLFGRLGKGPVGSRPSADATGELDELSADDILEVSEIGAFVDVEVEGSETPPPVMVAQVAQAQVAQVEPSVVVAEPAAPPAAVMHVHYAPPPPTTLLGMPPAAPITSPLPLEPSPPSLEKTVETRPEQTQQIMDTAKVAKAAARLDDACDAPEQTEVLARSAMPPSLQHTPPPTSVHTPSSAIATAPAWQNRGSQPNQQAARPGSIAPVALDVGRSTMPSLALPPPAAVPRPTYGTQTKKSQSSGMMIGMIAGGALLLVGLVGAGGFFASRALSSRSAAVEADQAPSSPATAVAAAAATESTPAGVDPGAAPTPATPGIDVSSLPAAPAAHAGPHAPAAHAAPVAPRTTTASGPVAAAPATPPPPAAVAPAAPPAKAATPAAPNAAAPNAAAPKTASPSAPPSTGAVPPPAVAGATPAPASTQNREPLPNGVVRVDPSLRVVVVDGAFRRVTDGAVVVTCGRHKIKAGMSEKVVDVPCGGTLQL